jgi:hypothetical protein
VVYLRCCAQVNGSVTTNLVLLPMLRLCVPCCSYAITASRDAGQPHTAVAAEAPHSGGQAAWGREKLRSSAPNAAAGGAVVSPASTRVSSRPEAIYMGSTLIPRIAQAAPPARS